MKKLISSLLVGSLMLTLSASAVRPSIKVSMPLNKQSMQTVVGGDNCPDVVEATTECWADYEAIGTYDDGSGNIQTVSFRSIAGCGMAGMWAVAGMAMSWNPMGWFFMGVSVGLLAGNCML